MDSERTPSFERYFGVVEFKRRYFGVVEFKRNKQG
jgi:hypothetical protein